MDSLINEITAFAAEFVDTANERAGGKLNFSIESLQALDMLLSEAHDFAGDLGEKGIQSIANEAGSYILLIAKRHFGGEFFWHGEREQPVLVTGQPYFEVSLLAVEKAKGRIINGNGDNIPFFFDGFVNAVKKGAENPGYRAMIV